MNDTNSQVIKALNSLGWDQYYQAEETGWVLYLEGPSDLAILQALARTLQHPAAEFLTRPFVHYVATNLPQKAREHFYGLGEAKSDLCGIAIFDRIERPLDASGPLLELMWSRKEIENYLCIESVLLAYARHDQPDDLFGKAEGTRRQNAMRESISELQQALEVLGRPNPWSHDLKATDEFLEPLFKKFFQRLGLPMVFRKSGYHLLAGLLSRDEIDAEVVTKLDAIVQTQRRATPQR